MNKIILGVETSCDETSVSLVAFIDKKVKILSNIVSSQIKIHQLYGGVVPEVASRAHVEAILKVTDMAIKKAKLKFEEIDAIAVTAKPGLIGSLVVGISFAKIFSELLGRPCFEINHLDGHIYANFIKPEKIIFPAIVLVVSGGHTQIIKMTGHHKYKILGQTKDDAAGEAFDKVARILELNYPGGPAIEKIALEGNGLKYNFPRFDIEEKTIRNKEGFLEKIPPSLDFSFSGLKTAVLYETKKLGKLSKEQKQDLAASFQEAVVDVLVKKTIWAAKRYKAKSILLSGGVSANKKLRNYLKKEAINGNFLFFMPEINLSTDNAAMIAIAAYFKYIKS